MRDQDLGSFCEHAGKGPREAPASGAVTKRGISSLGRQDGSNPQRRARRAVAALLDSAEIAQLIAELEGLRWTGRKGYPIRSLVGACLAKGLYAIPTWSRTARLIAEHPVLQAAIGGCPSVYALYWFTGRLRTHKPLLAACIDRVTASLREQLPGYGEDIAIDASDLAAYANGQRYVSKGGPERERFSDPDASWGTPLGRLHAKGRRLLRIQAARGRLRPHRTSDHLDGEDGEDA